MDNQNQTPPKSPKVRRFPRLPRLTGGSRRRTFFRVVGIAFLVVLIASAGLAFWVYREAVGRFEVRKLTLPTRIYADYLPLQPGMPLQKDDLLEKLDRLGYRQTDRAAQPGEFAPSEGGLDIHLRAFRHPTGEYASVPVRIALKNSQLESVVNLREARPVTNAALEPELLTSILNENLENRRPVTLQQVPKHLQDAVVVTEDVRFWHHPGVDPFGIFRAVFRNVKAGGVSEGASTLTQQLVKNYYLTSERTFKRKIVEAGMAVILDAKYSKPEILEAYLNDIYLGRNRSISILGVGEASRFYFGKPIAEISIAEAAMIAGMIRSPNNLSPFNEPEVAMRRRNTVLGLMLKEKKITQQQFDEARASKLPKKPFRDRSGLTSIPFYVDRVLDEMKRDYGIDDVKGRGLMIYTAIDLAAQDAAAQTLETSLRGLEKSSSRLRRKDDPLQGVVIHADVPTGEIRALVGGRNYNTSQFNRALRSKRLVGSLFKPFVYLAAFEPSLSNQNITPATLVSDTRFVLKRRWSDDWSPRNYDNRYMGNVTVRVALEESLNSASVRIGLATGIEPILRTARTLGVSTELDDENPSIILGAVGVPPIEMAEAYATIARQGARVPLHTIRFVTNDRGKVVDSGTGDVKPVQVFPQRDVYLLTHVMEGVVNDGTAARARAMGFRKVAAGKTGTTNDKRDAWFIGFTPQTLALTWVGFDDNTPTGLSGGDAAVPMWARYMNAVTLGHPNNQFPVAPGITFSEVDEMSGGLATPSCPAKDIVQEAFKAGTEPRQPCPLHMGPQLAQTTTPSAVPMYDAYGNPIITNTATPMTSGSPDTTYVPPPPPTRPDSTLTGGFGRTDTGTPPPEPTTTTPDEPPADDPPPPPTDTTATTPPG